MPESERAKCVGCGHPSHVGGECKTFVDIPLGMPYCECIADTEPPLTCSEVVERLAKECFLSANPNPVATIAVGSFDRAKATAILHSWREQLIGKLINEG